MKVKLMSKMYHPTGNYSGRLSIGQIYEVYENGKTFSDRYPVRIGGRLAFIHKNDCEIIQEPTTYAPYTHQEMSLVSEKTLEKIKKEIANGCNVPQEILFPSTSSWNEAKYQVPIDTTTSIQDGYSNAYDNMPFTEKLESVPIDKFKMTNRKNYMSFAGTTLFQENINEVLENIRNYGKNKGDKEMVGLPCSVNFKKDRNRTTLLWNEVIVRHNFGNYTSIHDNYETTKSEAHNEKFNYLFGFLMAYFKKVHKNKSKTQRKKYLNTVLYPMKQNEQIAFLKGLFYENCGLNYKEAKEYLDKIEKGVEFLDGKEKSK